MSKIHKKPAVSVVIPAYNRPKLLRRAIKSVLAQSYKDFELIIVDDGSPDKGVKKTIEFFQRKDKRIRAFYQKNSGGPAGPRNVGIQNSKGEYIAFLDGDDEWLPEKLEKQIKLFNLPGDLAPGFVSCNAIILDARDNSTRISKIPNPKKIFEHLLSWSCVNSCSGIVIKKRVLDDVGLFDENFKMADDWDLCIRIAKKYSFSFVKQPLFKYWIGQDNVNTKWSISKKEAETERLFKKHESSYKRFPRAHALKLLHQGKRWSMSGKPLKGIACLLRSICRYPFFAQAYALLGLSLLGTPTLNFLARLRRKVVNHKL